MALAPGSVFKTLHSLHNLWMGLINCGLYYKLITIVNDDYKVIRMMHKVVGSPMIIILTTPEGPTIIILMTSGVI
jgi:hypothetical protein